MIKDFSYFRILLLFLGGGETITSSINFSLCSRFYWLEFPEPGGTVPSFWVYFTLHCQWVMGWPIAFMARLNSTRVASSRLGSFRAVARRLSSLGSVCFCLLSFCFFYFLYLLANFLLRALSFHFILLINLLEKLLFTAGIHSDSVCRSQKKSLSVSQLLFLSDPL